MQLCCLLRSIFIFQKHLEEVPEVRRLLMQSKAAPDIETMKEITKSMNPDTVKDLIDAAGISKVGKIIFISFSFLE